MKIFKTTLALFICCFAFLPIFAFASPIINRNGASMCKKPADIVQSGGTFSGQSVLTMSQPGGVNVRALAANTGDMAKNVPISITQNNPGTAAQAHTFSVVIDGVSHTVQLNTSFVSTVVLDSSYRISREYINNPNFNLTLVGNATQATVTVPASGLLFGNNYIQYPCNQTIAGDYLYGGFLYTQDPLVENFEQGFQNVYQVVGQSNPPTQSCTINFSANPSTTSGNSSTLTWTSNTGSSGCQPATSCVATSGWSSNGSSPNSSAQVYRPGSSTGTVTENYTISCSFPSGTQTATTSVTYQQQGPTNYCNPTLDASPNSVTSGSVINLYWTATGNSSSCISANYCLADDAYGWGNGQLSNQGTRTYQTPTSLASGLLNFRVKCYYPDSTTRTADDSVSVTTQTVNYGSPTIDASPSSVYPGGQVSIVWSGGNGAISCIAPDGWAPGTLTSNGSRLYPTSAAAVPGSNQSFQIRCTYPDGSVRDAIDTISFLNNIIVPPVIPPNGYTNPVNGGTSGIAGSPIVRTLAARSIEKTSAKLRGYFNSNGCPSITTWFEYGLDRSNLDLRSDSIVQANKYGNVEFVATNLRPATKYYYRIVGENCKGTSLGAIEWLMTARGNLHSVGGTIGSTNTNTTVRNTTVNTTNTTVVKDASVQTHGAGTSYLRLDITNDNDIPDYEEPVHTVIRGEVVVYRVVWENLTTSMLHDGKIRVNLPKVLTFMNSSNGIYDKDSHSVYMTIGDIAGRASGVEFITVQVTTSGTIGDPVIVEAIAAFDAPGSDAQVNATDFDEDILGDRPAAAAATPLFGNWMWIIGLILLIILVFLIARYHTLAGQYRQPQYYAAPPQYPPVVPVPTTRPPEPERDPFVMPVREDGPPVYKPFNPNNN